jgi:flavin reductase (DIM6/NTAB) family NADH-FMN oxidoreductase RutF
VTAVSPDDFRSTMASVCAPVTIVTAMDGERPHGTTVSAFSSLSLEPPLVMVALDRGSDLLAIVRVAGLFGVNLLSHLQDDLALRFAKKGLDKFEGVDWHAEQGVPRIADASGWLVCELRELHDGGDHEIAVGHVLAAAPIAGAPLVYHNRQFGTHSYFVGVDAPESLEV